MKFMVHFVLRRRQAYGYFEIKWNMKRLEDFIIENKFSEMLIYLYVVKYIRVKQLIG